MYTSFQWVIMKSSMQWVISGLKAHLQDVMQIASGVVSIFLK